MSNYFSQNLKYLREKRKLSQNRLADMIGVNQTTIARWEDDNRTPNLDNAIDVAEILNIPLPDLIGKDLRLNNANNPPITNVENHEKYKQILKEKGLMDENENLDEESLDILLKIADILDVSKKED